MNSRRLILVYTLLFCAAFGFILSAAFFVDSWSLNMRILSAAMLLITTGLWGIYDQKVKVLGARLERLEAEERSATHPGPAKPTPQEEIHDQASP